jgi:hypothetical protein
MHRRKARWIRYRRNLKEGEGDDGEEFGGAGVEGGRGI